MVRILAAVFFTFCIVVIAHGKPVEPSDKKTSIIDGADRPSTEGRSGTTRFLLTYDWRGIITDCKVIASSGHAKLDEDACGIIVRRAKFTPGKEGSPPRTYQTSIRWVIPDDGPPAATVSNTD